MTDRIPTAFIEQIPKSDLHLHLDTVLNHYDTLERALVPNAEKMP